MTATEYEKDLLYRLWCVMALGAGSRIINQLLDKYDDDAGRLYLDIVNDDIVRRELGSKVTDRADRTTVRDAEGVIDLCRRQNIKIISSKSRSYPKRLADVFAPPQILFCKGDISMLNKINTIGVVGTRKPSEYSRQVTDAAVSAFVGKGLGVVSGFAEGIDISAALCAVRHGGLTYAVLGCGADVDYPKPNYRYREIIASNGALITEFLPGTKPDRGNFPQRNRLLAGLSDCIIVMEASKTSGALNTASHAADQGKPVYVTVPADLFDKRYEGQAILIREGAEPFMGLSDVDMFFSDMSSSGDEDPEKKPEETKHAESLPADGKKSAKSAPSHEKTEGRERQSEKAKQTEKKGQPEKKRTAAFPAFEKGSLSEQITQALSEDGMSLMELSESLSSPADELLSALTELELDGYIVNNGMKYILAE